MMAFIVQPVKGKEDLLRMLLENLNLVASISEEERDWADDLTEEQIQSILKAKEQVRNGQYVSHEEVQKQARELLDRKRKEKNND